MGSPAAKVNRELVALGERFKDEIDKFGYGQADIAGMAGVDPGNLSAFLRGRGSIGSEKLLRVLRVSAGLGCNLDYIITGTRDPLMIAAERALDPESFAELGKRLLLEQRRLASRKRRKRPRSDDSAE